MLRDTTSAGARARRRKVTRLVGLSGLLLATALPLAGCTRKGEFQAISMWNESRLKPYEPGQGIGQVGAARQIPAGTVAQGELSVDTGRGPDGKLTTTIPFPVTKAVLERGQERYHIYCAPCHSMAGDGEGLVVKRGFPHPPDYALKRLREAPAGHFYEVITNGYGVMYPYADRVPPSDRWAITAYIRVLQAARKDVPAQDQWLTERVRARELGIPRRGGTMKPAPAEHGEGHTPAAGTGVEPSAVAPPAGGGHEAPVAPAPTGEGTGAEHPAGGGTPAAGENPGHG
ncbi:MAG: hypothetical protein K0Q72_2547 [Armatimonadetes bacterium]|nr:hypothetical protein [Armatimonadota bacterium]